MKIQSLALAVAALCIQVSSAFTYEEDFIQYYDTPILSTFVQNIIGGSAGLFLDAARNVTPDSAIFNSSGGLDVFIYQTLELDLFVSFSNIWMIDELLNDENKDDLLETNQVPQFYVNITSGLDSFSKVAEHLPTKVGGFVEAVVHLASTIQGFTDTLKAAFPKDGDQDQLDDHLKRFFVASNSTYDALKANNFNGSHEDALLNSLLPGLPSDATFGVTEIKDSSATLNLFGVGASPTMSGQPTSSGIATSTSATATEGSVRSAASAATSMGSLSSIGSTVLNTITGTPTGTTSSSKVTESASSSKAENTSGASSATKATQSASRVGTMATSSAGSVTKNTQSASGGGTMATGSSSSTDVAKRTGEGGQSEIITIFRTRTRTAAQGSQTGSGSFDGRTLGGPVTIVSGNPLQ